MKQFELLHSDDPVKIEEGKQMKEQIDQVIG